MHDAFGYQHFRRKIMKISNAQVFTLLREGSVKE